MNLVAPNVEHSPNSALAMLLAALLLALLVLSPLQAASSEASGLTTETTTEELVGATQAQASQPLGVNKARLHADAKSHLQQYLRIDTTNPPGNEVRGVEFLAAILEAEGIEYETVESAPGRGNLWARLEGSSDAGVEVEKDLVLLHHIDVVPADPDYWDVDPLSGVERDGYLYGRGALDTKGLGIVHLEAFLELHRSGVKLRRDVVYMATADEEAGGFFGAGWLVKNRPELFENVGLLLNEGGGGMLYGNQPVFSVEVTQKVPLWLRLETQGTPGHGSSPRTESAVTRLIGALARLSNHQFEARVVPAVKTYFEGVAKVNPANAQSFVDIESAIKNPEFLAGLQQQNPPLHALLKNTCSITRLEGSSKINVVPPTASAEIDCRLLPDQDPEAFLDELRGILDEPNLKIEKIMGFSPSVSSDQTELFRAIETVCKERFPSGVVVPSVVGGFTDSHFFRDLGITSYGFNPSMTPVTEMGGIHGNNERVSIQGLEVGVEMMLEILDLIAVR